MKSEFFDVVIVGAGLSGIGAGCHLKDKCPEHTFVILEGRDNVGGTWDLFRYPGIRSDSDMYTLSYSFKPWDSEELIPSGKTILNYILQASKEHKIEEHIRTNHKILRAEWEDKDSLWKVTVENHTTFYCKFLYTCSGYYRYDKGYEPSFKGSDVFKGTFIHAQNWSTDLEVQEKNIVVIGSGATAVTLVPELSKKAKRVTMLQRSPTYIASWPGEDWFANILRKFFPVKFVSFIMKAKYNFFQQFIYYFAQRNPDKVKNFLLHRLKKEVGPDIDVEKHFTPNYGPWDQRLCLDKNGDFFKVLSQGKASIVTDHIDSFYEDGIQLKTGEKIQADIIVKATGLELLPFGGMDIFVNGEKVDFSKRYTYKGAGLSNVPNFLSVFGYINASWTLRADLISTYLCRLLNYLKSNGYKKCNPKSNEIDSVSRPFIDGFTPGFFKRSIHLFPKQNLTKPWINPQNYKIDKEMFLTDSLDDGEMDFE